MDSIIIIKTSKKSQKCKKRQKLLKKKLSKLKKSSKSYKNSTVSVETKINSSISEISFEMEKKKNLNTPNFQKTQNILERQKIYQNPDILEKNYYNQKKKKIIQKIQILKRKFAKISKYQENVNG